MIENGKNWYLLDLFLPNTPDSLKTGYTAAQLEWCNENEGMIWSYLAKNEDLNSLSPVVINTYIGESPFTQNMSQEYSPGNIGAWVGWQIVKKYAEKFPNLSNTLKSLSVKLFNSLRISDIALFTAPTPCLTFSKLSIFKFSDNFANESVNIFIGYAIIKPLNMC